MFESTRTDLFSQVVSGLRLSPFAPVVFRRQGALETIPTCSSKQLFGSCAGMSLGAISQRNSAIGTAHFGDSAAGSKPMYSNAQQCVATKQTHPMLQSSVSAQRSSTQDECPQALKRFNFNVPHQVMSKRVQRMNVLGRFVKNLWLWIFSKHFKSASPGHQRVCRGPRLVGDCLA